MPRPPAGPRCEKVADVDVPDATNDFLAGSQMVGILTSMGRKGDFKKHEHDRDRTSGRFVKMKKKRAAVPAAPTVDLGADRCSGGPHLRGAEWAAAQIDGIVDKAVSMGHDPEAAREGVTNAVCLAARTHQGAVGNPWLKSKLLQMAEVEAEKMLLDYYGDPGCNGDLCGRGSEVLEEVSDEWGKVLEAHCDDLGCDLDGMNLEARKQSEGRTRGGIDLSVTSLVHEGRLVHPAKLGAAGVERPEWGHEELVRNEATGDDLTVKFGASSNGLVVQATFGGFWHVDEVRTIDDGDYDAAFQNLEANIRSDATHW